MPFIGEYLRILYYDYSYQCVGVLYAILLLSVISHYQHQPFTNADPELSSQLFRTSPVKKLRKEQKSHHQ
jgi:hypothetical protein